MDQHDPFIIKKQSNASTFFKVGIFICIALLVSVAIYFASGVWGNKNALTKTGYAPSPSGNVEEVSPWSNASIPNMQDPAVPNTDTLHALYRQVRESIRSRDFDKFKKLASPELIWNIDHQKKLIGETAEGIPIWELTGLTGIDNFRQHAPYSILNQAPEYNDIIPIRSERIQSSSESDMYVYDRISDKTVKIRDHLWAYRVGLIYSVDPKTLDKGTGSVIFVYDNGKWKYDGEHWTIEPHSTPQNFGDTISSVQPEQEIAVDPKTGKCSPSDAKIKAGSRVVWKNITGRIYSIDPSVEYWQSPYLYNDRFRKNFNSEGTHRYVSQGPLRSDLTLMICSIIVEK